MEDEDVTDEELLELIAEEDDADETDEEDDDMLLSADASGMRATVIDRAVSRERDFFIRKTGEGTHTDYQSVSCVGIALRTPYLFL